MHMQERNQDNSLDEELLNDEAVEKSAMENEEQGEEQKEKSTRGFASMSEEERRAIASKGGRSQGKDSNPGNFANDPARAREAGRKGGQS